MSRRRREEEEEEEEEERRAIRATPRDGRSRIPHSIPPFFLFVLTPARRGVRDENLSLVSTMAAHRLIINMWGTPCLGCVPILYSPKSTER